MDIQDFIAPGALTLAGVIITAIFNWRRDVMNARKSERDQKANETQMLINQLTADYARIKAERDGLEEKLVRERMEHEKRLEDVRAECEAKEKRLLDQLESERANHATQLNGMKQRLQEKDEAMIGVLEKIGKEKNQ